MMLTLKNDILTVEIDSLGAQLCSVKNAKGLEYIWGADPAVWNRHAPLLFPVIGRLRDGYYTVHGEKYEMGSHGFARDAEFAVVEHSGEKLVLTMTDSEETRKCYPFAFSLTVTYELVENRLKKTCTVENRDGKVMYYELGGHDGFMAPHDPEEKMGQCAILLPGYDEGIHPYGMDETNTTTDKGDFIPFPDGRIPLRPMEYGLDTFILDSPDCRVAMLIGRDNQALVQMEFADFPYLGIWTQRREFDTNYVCIEPWSTLPDATFVGRDLSEKAGIRVLQPGERENLSYTTTFYI